MADYREQIRKDAEVLHKSGVCPDHIRRTADKADRQTDQALERRERDAQRKR